MSSGPYEPTDPDPPKEPEDGEDEGLYEDTKNPHSPINIAPISKRGESLENQGADDNSEIQLEDKVAPSETFLEIQTNINNLPEPYQTAMRLHYLESYNYPDLVKLLHLPMGTIKSHISRGKKMLQELPKEPNSIYQTQSHMEQIQTLLTTCGDKLREPYKTAMRLHYLNKYSYPEIARQLQQPVGTIKSYISRGAKMLDALRDEEESSRGDLEGEEL